MVNIEAAYVITWVFSVILYMLRWSSLNIPMSTGLISFFIVSIALCAVISFRVKQKQAVKVRWKHTRKPIAGVVITAGFILDWVYRGGIPAFGTYVGYNPDLAGKTSVGIPFLHVALTAAIIVAVPYVFYLYMSENKKMYLAEMATLLLVLILNNSRGYIVFTLICCVLIFLRMKNFSYTDVRIRHILCAAALLVLGCYFISAMGNIRSGYHINDCSFIRRVGYYDNYPSWLSPHFMWAYTYITSSLANLVYNINTGNISHSLVQLIASFLPESISQPYLPAPLYQVKHLNASTGLISAACSYGVTGIAIFFIVQIVIYNLIRKQAERGGVVFPFVESMLCFLIIVSMFYSPFTSSAVCYIPYILIAISIYFSYLQKEGRIEVVSNPTPLTNGMSESKVDINIEIGNSRIAKDSEIEISIIIPTFNSEEAVLRAVKSVLENVGVDAIEIIIIDDGSTDNTFNVCQRMFKDNPRVNVLTQENLGVSAARNKGLSEATGKIVVFLDADDELPPNALKHIVDEYRNEPFDIMFGSYCLCYQGRRQIVKELNTTLHKLTVVNRNTILSCCLEGLGFSSYKTTHMTGAVWGKAYRLEFLKSHGLQFDTRLKRAQDVEFNIRAVGAAKVIANSDAVLYNYEVREGSHSHCVNLQLADQYAMFLSKVRSDLAIYSDDRLTNDWAVMALNLAIDASSRSAGNLSLRSSIERSPFKEARQLVRIRTPIKIKECCKILLFKAHAYGLLERIG